MSLSVFICVVFTLLVKGLDAYTATDSCKDTTCVYDYVVKGTIRNSKKIKEELTLKATVFLSCDSVGIFEGENVTYYCIEVKNVTSDIQVVRSLGKDTVLMKEEDNANTDAYMESKMNQEFCFVRNKRGKILTAFIPLNENDEVVNFKKAIVSTFQANFAETETEEETDSQSHHISHYTYSVKENKKNEHRTINYEDVIQFSGMATKRKLDYYAEEEIEIDKGGTTIHRSQGRTGVAVGSNVDASPSKQTSNENFRNHDIPKLKVESTYMLELRECNSGGYDSEGNFNEKHKRNRRSHESMIQDRLIAKWNAH